MELMKSGNMFKPTVEQIPMLINNAKKLGLNTLNVPIIIDFENTTASTYTLNTASVEVAKSLITAMNNEGLKTILEPYPLVANGAGSETDINPPDIAYFFTEWKKILRHMITEVANPLGVYVLNTSSNLVRLEGYSDEWLDVFSAVKQIFNGYVTYRTNWWVTATWDTGPGSTTEAYNNKLNNPLFGSPYLDFISISAYFELNNTEAVPSVEQLMADLDASSIWGRGQNIVAEVKAFYDKWKKPVFFGELGTSDREFAASQPWNSEPSATKSQQAQANVFEAYKRKFTPYAKGV